MRLMRKLGIITGGVVTAGCAAVLIAGALSSGGPTRAASVAVVAPVLSAGASPSAGVLGKTAVPVTASLPARAAVPAGASATVKASATAKASGTVKASATVKAAVPAVPAKAAAPAAKAAVASSGTQAGIGNPAGTAVVPPAARAVDTSHPNHVIGRGTPASCTSAAVVKAVAKGGVITFNCGPKPVTIVMKATAKVFNTSHRVVLDGGGKVTLSGGGKIRILYMNVCDEKQIWTQKVCYEQEWPQLVVQNMTMVDAYSSRQQKSPTSVPRYGGGAIFDEGGQLKVVNSRFDSDRCYKVGLDLGGGAIRAYAMWQGIPTYITHDTFTDNSCANGGALSGLHANFDVLNTVLTGNKATGFGANPAAAGTPGGGLGGAICTDGVGFNLLIDGTIIRDNNARSSGGAIFYTDHFEPGALWIDYSTLHHNPSGVFQNAPGIYYSVENQVIPPNVIDSTIN